MKKIIWKCLNIIGIGPLLQLALESDLKNSGWFKSFVTKKPIDANGKAIPWMSYAFLHFLEPRLRPSMQIFEYGCGHSTLWFASKVSHVCSVEHHKEWYQNITKLLPANCTTLHQPLGSTYIEAIAQCNKKFDIIIVDGRDRVACCKFSIDYLNENGVMILDNAEREHYKEAHNFMIEQGYKCIEYKGMLPIVVYASQTNVYYKPNNCLCI